ncbi:MAG: GrpB family protein [Actinomycetota bacterium]
MPPDSPQRRAVILSYDPSWASRGIALTEELVRELGPLALRVDHIGSTAIPGMAAKAIFDLQIGVDDLDEAARAFDEPLARLGFERWPYTQDHMPAGTEDDPVRWQKRLWSRREHSEPDVNLHVRKRGASNERLALLFRDWFRAHPEAVPSYAGFKQLLASAVADYDTYTDLKDPVVDLVVVMAEEWASETGWTP